MTTALLIAYVAALVALGSLRAVPMRSALVQRLRAFFPSWKFFAEIEETPELLVRVGADADALGAFERCWPKLERRVRSLLLNPEGNLILAYDSLLAELLADAEQHEASLGERVSYRLVERLVEFWLAQRPDAEQIRHYQFKVVTTVPGAAGVERGAEDVLLSPVLERRC